MEVVSKMNSIQLHLLQFFAQKEVSKKEAKDIQNLIAQYYFDKAEKELEKVIEDKKITTEDIHNLASEHLRTPYNKQ